MRVATDDGHTRQGQALLRTDHVHDALERVLEVIQTHAEGFTVFDQHRHLDPRHLTARIDITRLGRDVVIHGGEGL